MRALLLVIGFGLGGCTTVSAVAPTVPNDTSKRVEQQALPEDPAAAPLPKGLPKGDWTAQLEDGKCIDESWNVCTQKTGVIVSEERAWRDAQYRLGYRNLRIAYEADRRVWTAQRTLYEERLNDANTALEKAQPGWWDRHKSEICTILGIVVGSVTTVGIVYGLVPAAKQVQPQ